MRTSQITEYIVHGWYCGTRCMALGTGGGGQLPPQYFAKQKIKV